MHFYSCLIEDMAAQPMSIEVEFTFLHMEPLARALQENARSWVTSLGKLMNESARNKLMKLDHKLDVCSILYTLKKLYYQDLNF